MEEAARLKNAVLGLVGLAATVVAGLGVVAAPLLIDVLVPGFHEPRRGYAIAATRVLFPGVALLVLSAWCLGVLNTHRRFFLSYAAPVIWNAAIIVAVVGAALTGSEHAVLWAAWGAAIGSALQFAVQLPTVIRVGGPLAPRLEWAAPATRTVFRRFVPAVMSRGIAQIGAFVDTWLASWLPLGAVATLSNAQILYTLPISLFGLSVTAAALPSMAEETAVSGDAGAIRPELAARLAQIAFFVIPSAVGLIALGGHIAGLLFQSGAFTADDVRWLWGTIAAAAVGLVPQAWARLLASTHFARGDTRTPFRFSVIRLVLSTAIGAVLGLAGPGAIGLDPKWGTVGLALGWAFGGLVEWWLLRRSLEQPADRVRVAPGRLARVWGSALAAATLGWTVGWVLQSRPVWLAGGAALATFGLGYLVLTTLLGLPEAARLRQGLR